MSNFRIKREGREYLVEEEQGLLRLARSGALLADDQLKEEPDGLWTDANLHPLLWEIFQADPWAAWDDLDEVEDSEEVWNALTRPASMARRTAQIPKPTRPDAARPKAQPLPGEDAETLAPIKPRSSRRRRSSSVTTGNRWSGPTNPDKVAGGDLRPGVKVERPAGIKIDTLPTREDIAAAVVLDAAQDADSGRIKIKVPDATETRVVPPSDMVVEPVLPEIVAPGVTLPPVGPRGQVIAFPAPTPVPASSRGGAQPAVKLDDPTLPPRILRPDLTVPGPVRPSIPSDGPIRPFSAGPRSAGSRSGKSTEGQTLSLSMVRVVPVVLLFGGMLAMVVWWVQYQSQQTFDNIPVVEAPMPPSEDEEGSQSTTRVDVQEPGVVHSRGDDEPEMLKELRDRLPIGDQRDVKNAEDLEEAIFIDLSRLQIHGVDLEANVIEMTLDEENPLIDKVTLVVQADSYGEPERELTAIGLVVGKYITHLDLNMLDFEVQLKGDDGKAWRKRPDPKDAAALYSRDISLEEYLLGG